MLLRPPSFLFCLAAFLPFSGALAQSAAPPTPDSLDYPTALRLLQSYNYTIRKAEARVGGAEGSRLSAGARRLPSLALSAQYQRLDENRLESFSGTTFGDTQSWNADLTATQPLYTGGNISAGIDSSEAEVLAARARLMATRQETLLQFRQAWYTALLRRGQISVQQRNVELREEQLDTTKDRLEAGTVSRFEVLRAEVALANARPPLIRARNNFRLAVVDLLTVIGLPAPSADLPEIEGDLRYQSFPADLREALATARQQRPEYRAFRQSARAAQAAVRETRSARRPSLNLTASYGVQKSSFSDQLDDTVQGWSIGVQGSWNFWDWNQTEGRVLTAKASARQAELDLDELDLQVASEVRQALSSVEEAEQLVKASLKVVEQAREALDLAEDRFSVGTVIQLDVLEAQVALTEARLNELQALHDHAVAVARLEKAMGITPEAVPDPAN